MVSSVQECSISLKGQNHNVAVSRSRSLEEDPLGFEFHKAKTALMSGFSKPAPSKWDDAQKWIASPNSNRVSKGKKSGRQSVTKVVMEVVEDVDARRIDASEIKREIGEEKGDKWVSEPYPAVDSCVKSTLIVENSFSQSAAGKEACNLCYLFVQLDGMVKFQLYMLVQTKDCFSHVIYPHYLSCIYLFLDYCSLEFRMYLYLVLWLMCASKMNAMPTTNHKSYHLSSSLRILYSLYKSPFQGNLEY